MEEFQPEKQANSLKSNQLEKIQNEDDVKEVEQVPNIQDSGESNNPSKADAKKLIKRLPSKNKPNASKEATLVKPVKKSEKAPLLALEDNQEKQNPVKDKEIDKEQNIRKIAGNESVETNPPIQSDEKDVHGNEKVIFNP
jgi:hypothetical protein